MRTQLLLAIACAVLPAAATLAQIVTQPPEHAPRPEDSIARTAPPAASEHTPSVIAGPPQAPWPPFESLVQRDANGNPIPLREPIEVAALRKNPLVAPEDLARIQPIIAERQKTFEHIVIDNLDLAEKVEGGIFENLDLSNNQSFTQLLHVSMPLRPSDIKPLSKTLFERDLWTRDQQLMNDKIVQDYKFSVIPILPADATPEEKGQLARRSLALVYKHTLDEPMFEYRRLRLAAARLLPKTISSLSLDPKAADSAKKAVATLRPESDDATLLKALDEVNKGLNLDQRKQLLREASGH